MLQDDTARLTMEKFNTIPAHPVDTEGLDVPELFKQVLEDLAQEGQRISATTSTSWHRRTSTR